jgi:pteridine reductase
MHDGAVLVTGAARRIGAAIARGLHAAGCHVVLHCHRSRDEAERLADALNSARAGSCAVVQADLLEFERLPAVVEEAAAAFGRLDGLVNNASSFYPTPFGSIGAGEWDELVGSNLRAPLFLAQAAAPYLRAARGAIVNLVDIHAERPLRDFVVYSVAKSGLAGLTRTRAHELGPDGDAHFAESERARILEQTPLKRIGSPEDVAGAVKYLLLDAPFVTGQVLAVDGGRGIHI